MKAEDLRQYIVENNLLEDILDYYDFTYTDRGKYLSVKNMDGDNPDAIVVYKDTLVMKNYTRSYQGDLFTLIQKTFDLSFPATIESIMNAVGLEGGFEADIPEVLREIKALEKLNSEKTDTIYDESVLDIYEHKPSILWYHEGIDVETQGLFNICYDKRTDTIAIPIRDEFGNLVGVKNRKNTTKNVNTKYYYDIPCLKSRVLYGLHLTKEHILEKGYAIVVESEKTVLKLWSNGIKNAVSIGSKDISKHQVNILERLGVKIVFALDNDVLLKYNCKDECSRCKHPCVIKQMKKINNPVYVIYDENLSWGIKGSPMDAGLKNFKKVFKNNMWRYSNGELKKC